MENDFSTMKFGKYKYMPIFKVPADYLLDLLKSNKYIHAATNDYVRANLERIKSDNWGKVTVNNIPICTKIRYISSYEAKKDITRMKWLDQEHKKPVRAYECEVCGDWHLTSKA